MISRMNRVRARELSHSYKHTHSTRIRTFKEFTLIKWLFFCSFCLLLSLFVSAPFNTFKLKISFFAAHHYTFASTLVTLFSCFFLPLLKTVFRSTVYWRACTFNLFNVHFQPPSVFNYKICNPMKQTHSHIQTHLRRTESMYRVLWAGFKLLWIFFCCCCCCSRCVWSTQRSTANRPTNQPTAECCSVHTVHYSDSEWCLRMP